MVNDLGTVGLAEKGERGVFFGWCRWCRFNAIVSIMFTFGSILPRVYLHNGALCSRIVHNKEVNWEDQTETSFVILDIPEGLFLEYEGWYNLSDNDTILEDINSQFWLLTLVSSRPKMGLWIWAPTPPWPTVASPEKYEPNCWMRTRNSFSHFLTSISPS